MLLKKNKLLCYPICETVTMLTCVYSNIMPIRSNWVYVISYHGF